MKQTTTTTGFPCEECGAKTAVIDSRARDGIFGRTIIRKRYCNQCGHTTLTTEIPQGAISTIKRALGVKSEIKRALNALDKLETKINGWKK